MGNVRDTINVNVEYFTDDVEYGPYYVASCDELSLVTDGRPFEEFLRNLQEAISLLLVEEVRSDFNLIQNPRVVLTMTLPENYAQTA